MVSPIGNTSGASFVMLSIPIRSDATASPSDICSPSGPVASATISSGDVISGMVVSTIDIICVSDAVFPEESVAFHVMVVIPIG